MTAEIILLDLNLILAVASAAAIWGVVDTWLFYRSQRRRPGPSHPVDGQAALPDFTPAGMSAAVHFPTEEADHGAT